MYHIVKNWSGANSYHEYCNDYLDSDKIANIHFTSDVDATNRVRDLNELVMIFLTQSK